MEEFNRFIKWAGGIPKAAEKLGISYNLAHKISRGERPITANTARLVVQVGGSRFSLAKLLEVRAA